MSPGTFLFDRNFKFKDGEVGEKIFILLNNGASGSYVCAKTTSRGHRYGIQHGCQAMDRFPNFHLVKGSCCLSDRTWIQLDSFYEFKAPKLMESVLRGAIVRIGTLDQDHTIKLLICASHSEDVTSSQEKEIAKSLQNLRSTTV